MGRQTAAGRAAMIERLDPSTYSVPDGSIVAVPAAGEVLYRLLIEETPTPGAFLSRSALGRPAAL